MPELLTILSGREATVRRLDALRERRRRSGGLVPAADRAPWPGDDSDGAGMYLEAAE